MGITAVHLLLKAMNSGRSTRTVSLPVELVVRDSTDVQARFCAIQHILEDVPDHLNSLLVTTGGEAVRSLQPTT
jgi:hypothetical protein